MAEVELHDDEVLKWLLGLPDDEWDRAEIARARKAAEDCARRHP